MMTKRKWAILLNKDGTPFVLVDDTLHGKFKIFLDSDSVFIDESGIEFDVVIRGKVVRYQCSYADMVFKDRRMPVCKMIEMGAIEGVKMHVLCFLYELFAGVQEDRRHLFKDMEPFDLEATLEKYSEVNDQLCKVDWGSVIEKGEFLAEGGARDGKV